MRYAIIVCIAVWAAIRLTAQEFELRNKLIDSPLGKVAFGLDVSPSEREYVIAGRGDTMVVLDASTDQEKRRVKLQPLTLAVGYSPDGKTVAALSHPGVLQLLDTDNWKLRHRVTLAFRCGYLSFHPTKPWIAVGGAGPTVDIYDYKTGAKLRSLGKSDRTQGVMFAPDGESIYVNAWYLTPTNRSELKRYSLTDDSSTSYPSQPKVLRRIVVSPDEAYLATVSPDGYVMMVGLNDGSQRQWHVDDKLSQFAMFLPDGQTLLIGGNKGWHRFQAGRVDPFEVLPASDLVSAYDGRLLADSNELLIAHARQPNQLTRWALKNLSSSSTPTGSSDVAAMTPRIDLNSVEPTAGEMDHDTAPSGNTSGNPVDVVDGNESVPSPLLVASRMRVWTSTSGATIEAYWIGNDATDVLLRTKDAVEKVVPRRLLSETDRQLLSQIDRLRHDFSRENAVEGGDGQYESINYRKADVIGYRENVALPSPAYRGVSAYDVEQDSFGRVWASCALGLLTYREDQKFYFEAPVPVTNPTTDISNSGRISALAVDRSDRIVATTNESAQLGDVYRYDGTCWTKINMPNGLLAEDVIRFGDKVVASGDFNGLAVLDDDDCRIVEQKAYPERIRTRKLSRLPDGRLLVRVKDHYPLIFDGTDFEVLEVPSWRLGLKGDVVELYPRMDGDFDLIAGSFATRNVYRYSPETRTRTIIYDAKGNRDATAYSVARAADGVIWLVNDKAVLRKNGDAWQTMGPGRCDLVPLPDGRVWSYVLYQPTGYVEKDVPESKRLYAHFDRELLPQRTWDVDLETSTSTVRVWSDSTGEYKTRASLVKVEARAVTLRRVDGRRITIPIVQLSQKDQDYLKTLKRTERLVIPPNPQFDPSQFQYTSFTISGFSSERDGSRTGSFTRSVGAAVKNDRYPDIAEEQVRLRRVNGVVSDRNGRIWIAGNAGLYEFKNGEIHLRSRGPEEVINHATKGEIPAAEASRLRLGPDGFPIAYFARVSEYYRFQDNEFESLGQIEIDGEDRPIFEIVVSSDEVDGDGLLESEPSPGSQNTLTESGRFRRCATDRRHPCLTMPLQWPMGRSF
ncbi:MAG: SHD1 domain-containing protein [Planctomycetota bacterium]